MLWFSVAAVTAVDAAILNMGKNPYLPSCCVVSVREKTNKEFQFTQTLAYLISTYRPSACSHLFFSFQLRWFPTIHCSLNFTYHRIDWSLFFSFQLCWCQAQSGFLGLCFTFHVIFRTTSPYCEWFFHLCSWSIIF